MSSSAATVEAKLAFAGSWAARASSFAVASAIAARVVASISAGVFSNLGRVRIARLRAAAAWKAATSRKGVAAGSGAAPAAAGPASADIRTGVVRTAITKPRILSHMGWFISLNCEEGDLLAYDEAGLRVRLERRGQARLGPGGTGRVRRRAQDRLRADPGAPQEEGPRRRGPRAAAHRRPAGPHRRGAQGLRGEAGRARDLLQPVPAKGRRSGGPGGARGGVPPRPRAAAVRAGRQDRADPERGTVGLSSSPPAASAPARCPGSRSAAPAGWRARRPSARRLPGRPPGGSRGGGAAGGPPGEPRAGSGAPLRPPCPSGR